MVKILSALQEIWFLSLGQEDPLETEMATHSSILAWKIPCTEEPGRLQYMGSQRVRHDWTTNTFTLWTFFGIALLWKWNESWPFQFPGHCWVFQICWRIEYNTSIASSFNILNSSVGILSPPLALFLVMLPKAHLTSHSKMSGSRWVATPLWLSKILRPFFFSFSVYSCHLFLISSASVRSFCPLSCQSLHEMFPWYLQFSWRDLLSFPFHCFPLFLFTIYLRRPSFLSLLFSWVYLSLSFLPSVSLPFSIICKASSNNHVAFLNFFSFGIVLVIASYIMLQTPIHSSLGTLSTRI